MNRDVGRRHLLGPLTLSHPHKLEASTMWTVIAGRITFTPCVSSQRSALGHGYEPDVVTLFEREVAK